MPEAQERREGISVRPWKETDDAFLFDLFARVRMEEFSALGLAPAQLEALLQMQYAAQCRSYAAAFPNARRGIICDQGASVGQMITDDTGDALLLVDMSLLPACRNRGIGSTLLRRLQTEAGLQRRPIRLHVNKSNPAQHLYRRLGFLPAGDAGPYQMMEWQPPELP